MSIEIKITDPHLADKQTIHKLGIFLIEIAGGIIKPVPVEEVLPTKEYVDNLLGVKELITPGATIGSNSAAPPHSPLNKEIKKPTKKEIKKPIISPVSEDPSSPDPENDFTLLMDKIAAGIKSGALKPNDVLTSVREFGVPSLPQVSGRPDLIPMISAFLDSKMGVK